MMVSADMENCQQSTHEALCHYDEQAVFKPYMAVNKKGVKFN